jgi:hypothetical protein
VTIVVAGYAALVGTLALAVQVATWFRTWATRVEVTLSPMQIIDATGTDEAIVLFRMINHSEHPVKITSLGFAPQKRGGMGAVIARPYPLGQPLPIPIAPRDQAQAWTHPDKKPNFLEQSGKVRAVVSTSDGKTFRSKKVSVAKLFEIPDWQVR